MNGEYTPEEQPTPEILGDPDTTLDAPPVLHYYGTYVRRLFFSIGLFMLLGLPFFAKEIRVGMFVSILGIVVIILLAGMTSRMHKSLILFDILVSLIGTLIFELFAFFRFNAYGNAFDAYFWFNEILAILFFISLYLSVKTLRGMILQDRMKK